MTLILDNIALPERGRVDINFSFEIKVTAAEAQKKVKWWLRENISMLVDADEDLTLVAGDLVVWRVPAYISFPSTGRAGNAGYVDVNVATGEMYTTPECKAEIERRAEEIAKKLPPFKVRELPPDYIAKLDPPPQFLPKKAGAPE